MGTRGFTVKIPKQIAITVSLEQGTVYLFSEESFDTTTPHFFIILNKNPVEDPFLIMTCATSQVEKRYEWVKKNGLDLETIVPIDESSYKFLNRETVVDCNQLLQRTKEVLMDKYDSGNLKLKGKVTQKDLNRIINGVRKSKLVSKSHKNLL